MNKQELYRLLDMESPEDFRYFENIADLFEADEDIDADVIYQLVNEIDIVDFSELSTGYFDQTLETVPDSEVDLYNLIDNIKRVMAGLSSGIASAKEKIDRGTLVLKLSDEIERFRRWYSLTPNVECINENTREKRYLPVRDALFVFREEKIGGAPHRFDFTEALTHELDEYMMSFADLFKGDEQ